MFTKLVGLGLLLTPFVVWQGLDTREPKLFAALVFSLALGLHVFYKTGFAPYRNKWLLWFLAFIPVSFLLAPKVDMLILDIPVASWSFQAFLYVLVFFLGHAAVSSVKFHDYELSEILSVMVVAGTVMAVYGILQFFALDQFFVGQQGGSINVCGTLGNPTILAPFIAMIIPIALFLGNKTCAGIMILTVFLSNSQVGYGSMILSLMFLVGTKGKTLRNVMLGLFVVGVLILSVGYFKSPAIKSFVGDNTRFQNWAQIVKDVKDPIVLENGNKKSYTLTGYGLGSFAYLYHSKHKNAFQQAHNEYLELFYNLGVIGLGLFLIGLFFFVKDCFPLDRLSAHLLSSFICIALCAGGTFIWQTGATIFYTLVITGLLTNKSRRAT